MEVKIITLPVRDKQPQSIEDQIYAAVYSASVYNFVTKIEHGHQAVYIVPERAFDAWRASLNA